MIGHLAVARAMPGALMATYGMGTAEVLRLQLEDMDWRAGTIHVVRPKTGVHVLLPLLAGPADALLAYLQNGRPRRVVMRAIFVAAGAPYGAMSSSSVRRAVRMYAHRAGISRATLGGHILRHSHACRQIELAAPPAVVSEILGHRNPASTSSYFRVATTRLRELALPLPK
jgi:integrase